MVSGFMASERWDGWCERGILGLVLLILVAGPLALGGVAVRATTAWQFLMLQGLTVAVMALWGVRLWVSPRPQLLWPPVCWAVLAFTGYAVFRYARADVEYAARLEVIRILVYTFLFFAILNNLHRQESVQIIMFTLVFLGMAISVYAIYQFATKSNHVWNEISTYQGRAGGTFYNPNNLAGFLEMLVPLGLCHMLAGRLSHVAKILLGYASLVMLVAIGCTASRGGWIVTGLILAALCGVLLFHRNYRIQALVLLVLVGGAAYFLAPKFLVAELRFKSTFSSGKADDMRYLIWGPAVRMWRDQPWLGIGPGGFDQRFAAYRPVEVQLRPGWVHNDYLNTLVDYGVVGTVLAAAVWVLLFAGIGRTWKHVRAAPDDFSRRKSNKFAFLLGATLALGGVLVHSVVDFNLHIPANAILAVTFMALLTSQWRFATERFWFSAGFVVRSAVTLVLLAGAGVLGYAGWRNGAECLYLRQAEREFRRGPNDYTTARIARLEQAWQAEPQNFNTTFDIAECYR
jgi:O-antigen ligase